MTTGPGGAKVGTAWGGGCTRATATQIGAAVGWVTLAGVTIAGLLVFDNAYSPLGESRLAGISAASGAGVVAALASFAATRWVARRSRALLVSVLALATAAGWVLMPQKIDVSESWVPQPNARYACNGWTFRHYPPATFDASATVYCVGFEHRIADG
ncbi:MAG TPA: hypothetical protein VK204_03995 [Nocardioidaceae bacterium]|nr:hypothetical protein [Nocardioidaceae bacterium]